MQVIFPKITLYEMIVQYIFDKTPVSRYYKIVYLRITLYFDLINILLERKNVQKIYSLN